MHGIGTVVDGAEFPCHWNSQGYDSGGTFVQIPAVQRFPKGIISVFLKLGLTLFEKMINMINLNFSGFWLPQTSLDEAWISNE